MGKFITILPLGTSKTMAPKGHTNSQKSVIFLGEISPLAYPEYGNDATSDQGYDT